MTDKPAHMSNDVDDDVDDPAYDMSDLDLSLYDYSGTSADDNVNRSFLTIAEKKVEHGKDATVDDDATLSSNVIPIPAAGFLPPAVNTAATSNLDAIAIDPESTKQLQQH